MLSSEEKKMFLQKTKKKCFYNDDFSSRSAMPVEWRPSAVALALHLAASQSVKRSWPWRS